MIKFTELGLHPAEQHRVEAREIREEALTERMEIFKDVATRTRETVTENFLPASKKAFVFGLRHTPGAGSLVEGLELAQDKNLLTEEKLTNNERILRYLGVSLEALAIALFIYALQHGQGEKMLQDLSAGLSDAKNNLEFEKLF